MEKAMTAAAMPRMAQRMRSLILRPPPLGETKAREIVTVVGLSDALHAKRSASHTSPTTLNAITDA